MKKSIITIIATITLAACAQTAGQLDGTSYTISELNGTELAALEGEPAAISFEKGKCNAYVGGNRIFANYKEGKGGELSFGESGATRMLVPDELREDEFIAAFNAVASYAIDGELISFMDADGLVLFRGEAIR